MLSAALSAAWTSFGSVTSLHPAAAGLDYFAAWTVTDDEQPGTVRFSRGAAEGAPSVTGTASDLLLWLYRRVELPVTAGADGAPADELVRRFRALTFTD